MGMGRGRGRGRGGRSREEMRRGLSQGNLVSGVLPPLTAELAWEENAEEDEVLEVDPRRSSALRAVPRTAPARPKLQGRQAQGLGGVQGRRGGLGRRTGGGSGGGGVYLPPAHGAGGAGGSNAYYDHDQYGYQYDEYDYDYDNGYDYEQQFNAHSHTAGRGRGVGVGVGRGRGRGRGGSGSASSNPNPNRRISSRVSDSAAYGGGYSVGEYGGGGGYQYRTGGNQGKRRERGGKGNGAPARHSVHSIHEEMGMGMGPSIPPLWTPHRAPPGRLPSAYHQYNAAAQNRYGNTSYGGAGGQRDSVMSYQSYEDEGFYTPTIDSPYEYGGYGGGGGGGDQMQMGGPSWHQQQHVSQPVSMPMPARGRVRQGGGGAAGRVSGGGGIKSRVRGAGRIRAY